MPILHSRVFSFLKGKLWCCKAEHVAPKAKQVIDGSGTVHHGCLQHPHPHPNLLHLPVGETAELRVELLPWEVWEWHSDKAASGQGGGLGECGRSLLC